MTIGKRMVLGMGIIIVLLCILGSVAYWDLGQVIGAIKGFQDSNQIVIKAMELEALQKDYFIAVYEKDLNKRKQLEKRYAQLKDEIVKAIELVRQHNKALKKSDEISKANDWIKAYESAWGSILKVINANELLASDLLKKEEIFYKTIEKATLFHADMVVSSKTLMGLLKGYFTLPTDENWEKTASALQNFEEVYNQWFERIKASEQLRAISDEIKAAFIEIKEGANLHHQNVLNQRKINKEMDQHLENIMKLSKAVGEERTGLLQEQVKSGKLIIVVLSILSVLGGIAYSYVSSKKTSDALKGVANRLFGASEEMKEATEQVASSSQSLAEGASEQASAIEETASALEELSSMSKANSQRALEAAREIQETKSIVEKANNQMEELEKAVDLISNSANETQKIIKTIEEIAFQTNLLALNAAVEAARAGEAGAGFAVVADEVRRLAMKATESARVTSKLIGEMIKAVERGIQIASFTKGAFRENLGSTSKVFELVQEIAISSQEQANGVEQINKAISEMDKVVQQTASSAEESAGAAAEMRAKAEEVLSQVGYLRRLSGVDNGNTNEKKSLQVVTIKALPGVAKKNYLPIRHNE